MQQMVYALKEKRGRLFSSAEEMNLKNIYGC